MQAEDQSQRNGLLVISYFLLMNSTAAPALVYPLKHVIYKNKIFNNLILISHFCQDEENNIDF